MNYSIRAPLHNFGAKLLPMKNTLHSLANIFFDEKGAERYLEEQRVYYAELICDNCGSHMSRSYARMKFRCLSSSCQRQLNIRAHTFFSGNKLKAHQILLLAKLWVDRVGVASSILLTGHSPDTVVQFYNHFRCLVSSTLVEEDRIIGGPGVIVEVDETKLGKRKYNRGHRVEGVWVVVGVERTVERRAFAVSVEKRDADTLREIVLNHVRPGSVIHTDLWKGYSWLDGDGRYSHGTVNHSVGFKDGETGVHTNYVEGTNNGLKIRIPVRSRVREGIEEHLGEFLWRRKHESDDIWESLICAMRDVHYDLE